MRVLFSVIVFLLAFSSISAAAKPYNWRALKVGQSTVKDAKRLLGKPHQEYREQILYEKQLLESADPNAQPVRLDTLVLNLGAKGDIESIFLFPEWGTTDEQLRPIFGKGEKMTYRKFLSSMGKLKIGAGTRPDEKLHYVSLDAACEVFPQFRMLALYSREDVVTGNFLVQLVLFY